MLCLKTHRVTNSPGLSWTFLVLVPKDPHPWKPFCFRQTRWWVTVHPHVTLLFAGWLYTLSPAGFWHWWALLSCILWTVPMRSSKSEVPTQDHPAGREQREEVNTGQPDACASACFSAPAALRAVSPSCGAWAMKCEAAS